MDISQFPVHADLSPGKRSVLAQLLHGRSVVDIAPQLGIATSTVRVHVKRLHATTGTSNLHSLALWALLHAECCVREP